MTSSLSCTLSLVNVAMYDNANFLSSLNGDSKKLNNCFMNFGPEKDRGIFTTYGGCTSRGVGAISSGYF